MTHRTVICVLLVGVALIAACGLSNDGHDPSPTPVAASSLAAPPTEQSESSQVAAPPPSPATSVKPGYDGAYSLEERIFASPVIARVRLDSVSSSVESGPTYHGIKNRALLEFHFSVWEYLKGDGHENIVAVWAAAQLFDTRQEAEAALPAVVAARDTRWDDRDAIVFLQQFVTSVPSTRQIDRYYLSSGSDSPWYPDDRYSINSRFNNLWLPTEASGSAQSQPGGDEQRFLLYWPLSIWAASRITLGEMRARIAAVTAKLNAGDGSEEYGECVRSTYQEERRRRFREVKYPDKVVPAGFPPQNHAMGSGLPTASTLYEDDQGYGYAPDNRSKFWLDGGDADLFSVEFGEAIPYDLTGDGVNDGINFTRRVVTSRPIPEGVYKFHSNDLSVYFLRCDGFTLRYEWTVTVTAPTGTLHEAFFDPVTVGSAIGADASDGVLKPTTFIDANGASATIQRIAYESGTVKLGVTPDDALAGQVVDIIELDGTVSLSLDVADATVDAANDTLSWSVASQPWEEGDMLMLRIHDGP